jgi:hypothetical protein
MTRARNADGIEMPNESSTTTCCDCSRLHSSANSSIFFTLLFCCRLIKVLSESRRLVCYSSTARLKILVRVPFKRVLAEFAIFFIQWNESNHAVVGILLA